jgi:predicted HTH domain antitoxin
VIFVGAKGDAVREGGVLKLTVRIPESIVDALHRPIEEVAGELQKELALALYQRGVLSSGEACALSEMTRLAFEELLGRRRIQRHYTGENLEEDIRYARSHQ